MIDKTLNCAIYARVSTEEQDADKQEYICQEYAKNQGFNVFKVYKDVISGATSSRPAFNELINDLRQNRFNCIIVTKLDRLGRSLQHLLSLFDEFNNRGIHFIAITQNIDTLSSAGKLQLQILGAFAEFERNIISERTREGLKRKKKNGKRGKDTKKRIRRWKIKPSIYGGGAF
jgi:site-specific DNA recombinase